MARRRGRYGDWGKHLDIFEQFESWRDDPEAQEALAESEGWDEVEEGTGAPEGRADFPMFLLTTIRHTMRQAFTRRAAKWDQYMGVERAEDFRVHTVSQLNGLAGMGPVPEFDEYPRIRSQEEAGPPFSVGKHGGVYGVTFEMVVERRGEHDPEPHADGAGPHVGGVRLARRDRADRGEPELHRREPVLLDGRAAGDAGRERVHRRGRGADRGQPRVHRLRPGEHDGHEGFPIEIDARRVLTRDRRTQMIFNRIIRSQETGATSNDTGGDVFDKGRYNAASDLLSPDAVIVEPYLTDPNDWIVLNDVGRPAFVIAFLRDQREPFIGVADGGVRGVNGGGPDPYTLDFDEIPFKIRHVFGVALGDPRAARRARRA
jgi:hypothetical protein